VWILKIENSLCEVFGIWKFEIWNVDLDVWILKIENWKLKFLYEMFKRNLKFWKLKCLNKEN